MHTYKHGNEVKYVEINKWTIPSLSIVFKMYRHASQIEKD